MQHVVTTTRATPTQLAIFRACFSGLETAYGTYDRRTGRVYQVRQPVTDDVLQRHVSGEQPYGVYLLIGDRTRALVADFDAEDVAPPTAFVAVAHELSLPTYIERSKSRGFHIWMFFPAEGVAAALARRVAHRILARVGCTGIEVFPKQDRLDTRVTFGNFIFAPLFGASVARGRTVFVHLNDPTQPIADQWAYLERVVRVSEAQLTAVLDQLGSHAAATSTVPAAPAGRVAAFDGLPPCAERMLRDGVDANQRVACFRLAVNARRRGLSFETAVQVLSHWATRNRPAAGKRTITSDEIRAQATAAYTKPYRSFGCEDPLIQPYCDVRCPVFSKRWHTAAAARSQRHPVEIQVPSDHPPARAERGLGRTSQPERTPPMAERTANRPVREFRAGAIKVAIWQNEKQKDGEQVVRHSVRFGKRYLNQETGEWLDTNYFYVNDLPRLRVLVEKAFEFIAMKEADRDPSEATNGASPEAREDT